ncbi:MAG: hypothetical protein ACT4NL_05985 [Pseudomarimonas sp.]
MHALRSIGFVLLAAVAHCASAQSPLVLRFSSEPATRLTVIPRLTGALPGCPPERAELVLDGRFSGVLQIFTRPGFCPAVVIDSDLTLPPIAFPTMGIYTIRITDAVGVIETREVAVQGRVFSGEIGAFARFSVNGAWYAPEFSGSGLMMTHRREPRSESTVGAWFNFDGDGDARWYSLQGGRWISSTLLSGTIYKSRGSFQDCASTPDDTDCPESLRVRPARQTERLGSYEFEMIDDRNAILRFAMDSRVRHEIRLHKLL